MFLIGLIIGLFVGANLSLILYACIVAGKESDRRSGYTE
jgi:type III secretory pathway component EscT